jgi:hypothetical protein
MPHPRSRQGSQAISPLFVIKLMHTVIWAFFAGCIVALPVAGLMRRFDWALIFAAIVLVECAVLVVNRWRCPLTGIAARYTSNRADNFDIFLPAWLARHNKTIFGALFFFGGVVALWNWLA